MPETERFTFELGRLINEAATVDATGDTGGVLSGGRYARRNFVTLTDIAIDDRTGALENQNARRTIRGWDGLVIDVPAKINLVTASFFTALLKPWWDIRSDLSDQEKKSNIRLVFHGDEDIHVSREFVVRQKLNVAFEYLCTSGGYEPTADDHTSYMHELGLVGV